MILIRREGLEIIVFESAVKRDGDVEVANIIHGIDVIRNMHKTARTEAWKSYCEAEDKLRLLMEEKK